MSSSKGKGLGLLGLLGLVSLVVGVIGAVVYSLQAFDIADILPGDESLLGIVLGIVFIAPAVAVACGFLGQKFADSGRRKGKCFGVMLGGLAVLAYVAWLFFMGPTQ